MANAIWKRIGLAVVFPAIALLAQRSPEPKFDVVSIRPVPPDAPPLHREIDFTPMWPGGVYRDSRTSLLFLIAFAYNVKNPSQQLTGLPNWAKNESYAVAAQPAEAFPVLPPNENREQVRLMMRAMLEDRFHLQMHSETRKETVFDLVTVKGGLKIKEVDPPVPPAKPAPVGMAVSDSRGRLVGNKSTMASLASALSLFLRRPVIDKTGSPGCYDFDVKWSAPAGPGGPPAGGEFGAEGTGLLITNLEDQFGLRLMKTSGAVEYWVVDHVEPPTEN